MPKTINLRQSERAAETEAFRAAIATRGEASIGTGKFVASGSHKAGAPIRPSLTGSDFTASGMGKEEK